MICKNCGNDFEGNFCNQCGQNIVSGRFKLKEISHNFFHAFTHLDRGILFLVKELFFRPGIVAKEYLEGKRKKYFNPLQFLILGVAITTFIAINYSLFGPQVNPETIPDLTPQQKYGLQFNNFIYKYFNLIIFLSVPIMALYSRIVFKKSGYNYAENLIFNTFIAGERNIIYLLLTPFFYFFKSYWFIPLAFYYIGWNIYFVIAFNQFFGGKKLITTMKYFLVFILMWLTSQGITMIIFTIFFYKGSFIQ